FGSSLACAAFTAFQPNAASQVACAWTIRLSIASGSAPWNSSSSKEERKSLLNSALSQSTRCGRSALCAGPRASSPLRPTPELRRNVDPEEPDAVVAGEDEDAAVVVPVVAPVLHPPGALEELRLGELPGGPVVQGRLRLGRVHLQPDADPPAGAPELPDDRQL